MMGAPKAIEQLGKNFFTHPVCAGPFSFVERVPLDHITLQRFPGYWNADAIHVDRIEFHPIANSSVRLVNLQAGQLDMIEEMAPTDAVKVQQDQRLQLAKVTALGYEAMMINLGNGSGADTPLAHDVRVRAALEAAIDRNVINQVAASGLFVPDNQSELPTSRYFNSDVPVPPRDVARAKALLREAGAEHPTVLLRVLNTPLDKQIGEIIQSMASEAGFTVKVQAGETNANIAAFQHGEYQAGLVIWSGRSDPDFNITQFLSCDGFQNWEKYCNPDFQTTLDHAPRGYRPGGARGPVSPGREDLHDRPADAVPVPHDMAVCTQPGPERVHAGTGWVDPAAGADVAVGRTGRVQPHVLADRRCSALTEFVACGVQLGG